jgi:hypothetical protein
VRGLFNPDVHRLVAGVEARLGDVFVTYALSTGASPDLGAALAATRFAGCSSAVVVHCEEWLELPAALDSSTDTLWFDGAGGEVVQPSIESVIRAFGDARRTLDVAA